MQIHYLGLVGLPLASAFFSHNGPSQFGHPCNGQNASMVAASLPLVVDLAKQAMKNTDETLFRTWFGMSCNRTLINKVYGQIVDWYPLNSNFQCPPREGSCKGAAAFKGADSTGALFTALCPDFFRGPGGTDCKTFNKGYLSLLLHELSHQTEATIGWGVDDGPRDANGGLCYGAECVQRWARDATNCTNGHMADAYALFAAAVNCSSPAGGVGTLPAAADWTGVPAGYASSLPQGDAPNGTTYATPPAPQAGPSSTTLVPVPTPLPAQPNSAANNGSQSPPAAQNPNAAPSFGGPRSPSQGNGGSAPQNARVEDSCDR